MFSFFKRHARVHPALEVYAAPEADFRPIDPTPTTFCRKTSSPQSIVFEPFESRLGCEYDVLYNTGPMTWLISTQVHGQKRFSYPYGKYNFATMPDGTLRIKRYTDRDSGEHATLTSDAPEVLFAGEIKFKEFRCDDVYEVNGRQIEYWTNHSEDYATDSKLYKQAGLPLEHFVADVSQARTSRFGLA